jgi:hypothetical protein
VKDPRFEKWGLRLIDKTPFWKSVKVTSYTCKGEAMNENFRDDNPGSSTSRMERKIK